MHTHPIEFSVGLGFVLGMLHAIEPGHGKTAMFVYMLRQRSAFWHPVVMGLTTAVSHAFSLAIIAAVVHFGAHWLAGDTHAGEENVSTCLQWISSLLLIGIGLRLLVLAKSQTVKPRTCRCCGGNGSKENAPLASSSPCRHEASLVTGISISPTLKTNSATVQSETQVAKETPASQLRLTLLLGFAIGLLPCPTALAAYFAGLSSGNPLEGYRVILVFSAGIAVSLALCGFVLQWVGQRLSRWLPGEKSARRLAYMQAAVILLIGVFHLTQLYSGHTGH